MAYQSKTYSLSDEVITAIEAARKRGLTPNKYLQALLALEKAVGRPSWVVTRDAGDVTQLDAGLRLGDGRGKVTRETRRSK